MNTFGEHSPHQMFLTVEIIRHLSNYISRFQSTLKPNGLAIHRLEFSLLHEGARRIRFRGAIVAGSASARVPIRKFQICRTCFRPGQTRGNFLLKGL
jgi:hypothetical protein